MDTLQELRKDLAKAVSKEGKTAVAALSARERSALLSHHARQRHGGDWGRFNQVVELAEVVYDTSKAEHPELERAVDETRDRAFVSVAAHEGTTFAAR